MKRLTEKIFGSSQSAARLFNLLKEAQEPQCIAVKGVAGSSKAFLAAAGFMRQKQLSCFILPDMESAAYFYDDLVSILGGNRVLFFPAAYKRSIEYIKADKSNIVLKTEVLNKLTSKQPYLVVTYPEAIIERVIKKTELSAGTLEVGVGDILSMDFVIDRLNNTGFSCDDFVYDPGTFAVRGSIIDVFSYSSEQPFRIDFFGDKVESIRSFNQDTQLSTVRHRRVQIIPNMQEREETGDRISFFDFIDKNCVLWVSEPAMIVAAMRRFIDIAEERYAESKPTDTSPDDESICILNPAINLEPADAIIEQMRGFKMVEFAAMPFFGPTETIQFEINPQPAFGKQFDLLIDTIKNDEENGYQTFILSNNEKQIQRLRDIFADKGGHITFTPILQTINQGFVDNASRTCVYTDHQIFERYHRYSTRKIARKNVMNIQDITSLHPGDYVVHVDNGIGRFGGLQTITNNGRVQEVVSVIYDCNDVLYVNIHSLHRLSKYRDKDGEPPTIHRLGSGHWQRLKERAKKNIKDISKELILLYAQRRRQHGYAFSSDSDMQHRLESSFLYEDTPDQAKTCESIKADMESDIPMDRLVCGDVGFGKTELAIRAAYKAVNDLKQVAVLVPTTILALQHYETFTSRLKDFHVNIAYLSRLKSAKEVTQISNDVKSGKIDILIGTHKILNKNLIFKDLGLFIIDEEQKFGVATKEKLRQLKTNIDTLTLTATPIPRTLQFSLMGARDLSVINTPPANRQPIITELYPFNNQLIKDAIYYEVGRNGQVFFINNRIDNIYEVENMINKLCPEVKTVVAHGRMEGATLEKKILEFVRGDYDVLISTSIIENGVDIPNVNTIIINNANNFGLSDLHQMRGRVGRSNKKAFCYLLSPPLDTLTPEARRRLKAIEEFSDLGSGINIALQDLDIRGAGNILGSEQSGFIADIGFETYNKILNEAIQELKTGEFKDLFENTHNDTLQATVNDCQVETDLNILIPSSYISNTAERIKLYKELDDLSTEEALQTFRANLIDRFGKIPPETEKLFDVIELRWAAQKVGFQKIVIKNDVFIGYFPLNQQDGYYASKAFAAVLNYVQDNPKDFVIKEINGKLTLKIQHIADLAAAQAIIRKIVAAIEED